MAAAERVGISGADLVRPEVIRDELLGGCGRTTFWKIRRQPGFPKGFQVSGGLILFSRNEVLSWIKDQRQ